MPRTMRSPTGSGLGEKSDSQPNLTQGDHEFDFDEYQSTSRRNKRKLTDDSENLNLIKNEVTALSKQMSQVMSMLSTLATNQKDFMDKICQDVSTLKEQVSDIKSTVALINTEHTSIKSNVSNLLHDNNDIKEKVVNLENCIHQLKNDTQTHATAMVSLETESIVAELNERDARSRNVIMTGILESTGQNKDERIKSDQSEVMKVLKTIVTSVQEPQKIFRLGKYSSNKTRPLKLTFQSQDLAKNILKNRNNLRDDKVKLYPDQTPQQRSYVKKLSQELEDRIKKGEADIKIKYSRGVPKIIKELPKNLKK